LHPYCSPTLLGRRNIQHDDNQVSFSPTFYEQLLRQNTFAKKLQTQIASTLKLLKNFE
jgi:hypothetical protein